MGDDLAPGRKLVLRSGLAELMFTSGAKALLQGPATLEVGSKTSALLRRGKVTVTVLDPDARGFEIDTPGMKYTDLGTEFGVLVATDGVQEVHVFRGKVAAEQAPMRDEGSGMRNTKLPSPSGRGAGGEGPQPLILTANQAIRVASSGKPVERFAADERRFVRVMPQPKTLPVPIFNTGQGLVPGQPDPHWQIIAVPGDAKLQPRPATVAPATVHRAWDKFTSPQSKWISVTADTVAPPGMFQYRTQFDLGGIDPSSVVLKCGFAVDNRLVAVRLNGREIAVPRHSEKIEYNSFVKFQIDCQGLKPRQNTLEFVVENTGPGNSWSGLRVEFQGTGREISNHK